MLTMRGLKSLFGGKSDVPEVTQPLLDNRDNPIDPAPTSSVEKRPELSALQRSRTITSSQEADRARIIAGKTLYTTLHTAIADPKLSGDDFNKLLAETFDAYARSKDGGARQALEELLAYLDDVNDALADYESSVNTNGYLAEVRARLASKNMFRGLSNDEVVQHAELAFTLIAQLRHLNPEPTITVGEGNFNTVVDTSSTNTGAESAEQKQEKLAEENAGALIARIVARGEFVAKQLPMEKWKVAVAFFLGALGALTALVAVATVVMLAINPATAPVVAAVAAPIAKFGLEASLVAAFYFMAQACLLLKKRWQPSAATPEMTTIKPGMTTTEKVLARLKVYLPRVVAGSLVGTPAAIAGVEMATGLVVNPTSVAISSATAEAATGSATVTTATGGMSTLGVLTGVAATGVAGLALMRQAWNLFSTRNLAADHAKKVLDQNVESAPTRRPSSAGGVR